MPSRRTDDDLPGKLLLRRGILGVNPGFSIRLPEGQRSLTKPEPNVAISRDRRSVFVKWTRPGPSSYHDGSEYLPV